MIILNDNKIEAIFDNVKFTYNKDNKNYMISYISTNTNKKVDLTKDASINSFLRISNLTSKYNEFKRYINEVV